MDDGGLYADVLPEFDGHRSERLACFERCGDRALFYFLINYEADPDIVWAAYDRIRSCLAVVPPEGRLPVEVPCDGAAVEECLEALAGTHPRQFDVQGHDQAIECVRQYAPSALLEGCWLQNISAAATCHTEVAAHLFRSYMVGVGHGNNRYRSLLRRFGIDLPSVTTQAFSEHPELVDAAFHAPVVQLCLSLFPRVFLPELIGFTLAHANTTPAWLPLCALLLQDLAELPDAASLAPARRAAGLALHAYLAGCGAGSRQTSWQRIRRGFALYRWAELDLSKRLEERLGQPPTPRDRMIALLRQKAPYARGHHRAACIGGKKIDAWFSEDPFDAEGFLDALVQSDFVVPKAPAKSRLLADLTDFGGPMFRVFDEAERRVILEWLKSLSDQKIPPASTDPAAPMIRPASWSHVVARVHVQDRGHASTDARQLFYRLVNSDLFPDVLPAARRIVSRHLRKSAAGLTDRLPPLRQFFPYTHGAFQARIESLYEKERDAYRPFEPPPRLRRDVYVWGIEQMAPIVLVDGCWLQHVVQAGNRDSRLAAALFGIYADEVGNGHPAQPSQCVSSAAAESGHRSAATERSGLPGVPRLFGCGVRSAGLSARHCAFPKNIPAGNYRPESGDRIERTWRALYAACG